MRSGSLNHLVEFLEPNEVVASDGSISKQWYSHGTARCEMNPVPSTQDDEAGKQDVMQCRIRIRYQSIKPNYRLLIEGQNWAILSMETSPDRREIMLLCESAVSLDGVVSEQSDVSVVVNRMKVKAVLAFNIGATDLNEYDYIYYEGVQGLDLSGTAKTIEQVFAEIAAQIRLL